MGHYPDTVSYVTLASTHDIESRSTLDEEEVLFWDLVATLLAIKDDPLTTTEASHAAKLDPRASVFATWSSDS